MKKLILIFIFISGINLFAQTYFDFTIYNGEANYLDGYNQYLPNNYYIFNYRLKIVGNKYQYYYRKEYIYNYTNKKMYLLKDYYDYYYYDSSYNLKGGTEEKFYDLNGKRRDNDYSFAKRTVKGTNRYGEEIAKVEYIKYDYDFYNFWSIQSYKNSLKLPNFINPKNIGLYDGYLLALASEYQIYHSFESHGDDYGYFGYDYSGKDYIFGTNIYNYNKYTNYYIIDLETKSKINYKNVINKEEYEKRLKEYENKLKEREEKIAELEAEISKNMDSLESLREFKDNYIKEHTAIFMGKAYGYSREKAEAMAEKAWENGGDIARQYRELNRLEYTMKNNKKEIEKLKNEIKELEKSIEEFENIKKDELKNEYIKYFRNKFPELENDFYYFGENSITTNSINFIPFKYLKPYFEESVKTKEQFYKFINFENEK